MSRCACNPNETHGSACPIIHEFRLVRTEEGRAQLREEYMAKVRARQLEQESGGHVDVPYKLQQLGVPPEALRGIRAPRDTEALKAAQRFARTPDAFTLLLAGPHGCGKSTGAAWALGSFVRAWEWNSEPSGGKPRTPAIWVKADEVAMVTDFGRVDPEWLEGLRRARFLVVDDLGKDGTAPGVAALASLLCHRHEKEMRTVVTANCSLAELGERYGEAWLDRLRSGSIRPDLRGQKSLRGPKQ